MCVRNDIGRPSGQSDSLLTHTFSSAATLFSFFLMFMEDLDLFMYDNLYNMCMLICDVSAVYFCMLICDFIESTIVCRNKSPTGLMLCHVSHIRGKIIFLYLYYFLASSFVFEVLYFLI